MDRIKAADVPWANTGAKQSLDAGKGVLQNQFLNGPSVPATGGAIGVDSATPSLNPAEWANMITEEIRGVIIAAGLTPSAANWSQLQQAIAAQIATASAAYLPRNGSQPMTGELPLAGNASAALSAVPLQQVQALIANDSATAANNALAGHIGAADPHTQYVKKAGGAIMGTQGGANIGVSYNNKGESDAPLSYAQGMTLGVNIVPNLTAPINIVTLTGAATGAYLTFQNGDNPQLTFQQFFSENGRDVLFRTCNNNTWTTWEHINKAKGLGLTQTLTEVTAARAFGIAYTNTTALPIWVSLAMTLFAGADANLIVNGIVVARMDAPGAQDAGGSLHAVVAPGATYQANVFGTYGSLVWSELR
jgi:hypothetical protein